jgi:hypothetical protein
MEMVGNYITWKGFLSTFGGAAELSGGERRSGGTAGGGSLSVVGSHENMDVGNRHLIQHE